jgi:hypothetical protein
MCDPVQFFSYEPCGCGQFNPYFNENHPLNSQAQQAPETNTGSGGSTGGSTGQAPQTQRQPSTNDKTGAKLSGNRGGSGGGQDMRRGLKGRRPKMVQHGITQA